MSLLNIYSYSTICIKVCRTTTQQVNADGCLTSYNKAPYGFYLGMQLPISLMVAKGNHSISFLLTKRFRGAQSTYSQAQVYLCF